MLKITIQGEPSEIAAFFFHLEDCAGISLEYKTGISKRAVHHKWGSALAGLHVEAVELDPVLVTIYQGKGRKTASTKATPGYVYLMPFYGANGIEGYKIGKTTNPYSRRKTFSIKLNFKVEFIAVIATDDCSALETQLHREFADKRLGASEWFTLSADDVQKIQAVMSKDDEKLLAKLENQ